MSLAKRLLKNSTIKDTDTLKDSKLLIDVDETVTPVPMINVALSGDLDGGFKAGVTTFAGLSKTFKCLGADTPLDIYIE